VLDPSTAARKFGVRAGRLVRGGEARPLGLEDLQRVASLRADREAALRRGAVIALDAAVGTLHVGGDQRPGAREIRQRRMCAAPRTCARWPTRSSRCSNTNRPAAGIRFLMCSIFSTVDTELGNVRSKIS
jgi:hypothetical protein